MNMTMIKTYIRQCKILFTAVQGTELDRFSYLHNINKIPCSVSRFKEINYTYKLKIEKSNVQDNKF